MSTTSDRRTAANRANAALSTGPRTEQGKSVSSRNAATHGLTSETLVIFHWESQDAFNALQQAFHARFRPLDAVEALLVDRMVDTTWRRNRAIAMETTLLDLDIAVNEDELLEMVSSETATGLLRMSLAFRNRHGENTCIAIQRLLNGIEHSYSRARHELQLLQKDRFNNITVDELLALTNETAPGDPPVAAAEEEEEQQQEAGPTSNSYNEMRENEKSNPMPRPLTPKDAGPTPGRGC